MKTALKKRTLKGDPSQGEISQLVSYDAATGCLIWLTREDNRLNWNRRYAGKIAGQLHGGSLYKSFEWRGRTISVHRAVWILHHGSIPGHLVIDHINRDKLDNRIENLRLATRSENARNCDPRPVYKTRAIAPSVGLLGISFDKVNKKWAAKLVHQGVAYRSRRFTSIESAVEARDEILARLRQMTAA